MWPLFSHQNPGSVFFVLVVPEDDPGRGWEGDRGSMYAQAAVPGSSEPSGQSQVLSLTWLRESLMAELVMQVNSSFW